MLITINAQKKDVQATHLTYQEIVDMADSGRSKQALHSITYSVRGTGDKQGWERSGADARFRTACTSRRW
jgi:hypothetical protein